MTKILLEHFRRQKQTTFVVLGILRGKLYSEKPYLRGTKRQTQLQRPKRNLAKWLYRVDLISVNNPMIAHGELYGLFILYQFTLISSQTSGLLLVLDNGYKQYGSRLAGFTRSQLIWISTDLKKIVYRNKCSLHLCNFANIFKIWSKNCLFTLLSGKIRMKPLSNGRLAFAHFLRRPKGRRSNITLDLQFMQIFTNQKYS